MFERFTERARQTVVLAQQNARDLKHEYIGTAEVLLGVLQEEEGIGARVLNDLGLTYAHAFEEVKELHPAEGDGPDPKKQVEYSPRTKKVYELALREALSLGNNYIGTEHILLGLIREVEGVHAQVLTRATIDSQTVRDEIVRRFTGARTAARSEQRRAAASADLMRIGDRLQSEASRIVEYLKGERLPYEVAMAVAEVESAVKEWTETRCVIGAQRAA